MPGPSLYGKAAPILVQRAGSLLAFRTAVHDAVQTAANARKGRPRTRARGEAQSAE